MFEVRFSHKAEKFLKKCEPKLLERLRALFSKLQENPAPATEYDVCKIAGLNDTYRIRLSSYRTAYSIFWEQKIVRVMKIERRKDRTYKNLG